jgi:lysozyme
MRGIKIMVINPRVIDISHHNEVVDLKKAKDFGIIGIIHKASEGDYSVDQKYASRRVLAKQQGMLWGAYHFCSGDNVDDQIQFFIKAANPDDQTLMVLDYEQNFGKHGNMNVLNAIQFMKTFEKYLKRECAIYSGNWLKESIIKLGPEDRNYIKSRRLWLCQYTNPGHNPVLPSGFAKYWLWQYTGDGQGNEPHNIPGIIAGNKGLDINHYNGSNEQLISEWAGKAIPNG